MQPEEPPVIDFSRKLCIPVSPLLQSKVDDLICWIAIYGSDPISKENLIREIGIACETFGFFQLVNHRIPETLQQAVIRQSEDFFELPLETKEKYNKGKFYFLSLL